MNFEKRLKLFAEKNGLQIRFHEMKYGAVRAVIYCSTPDELGATFSTLNKVRGMSVEFKSIHDGEYEGRVYVMERSEKERIDAECAAEMKRLKDWWQRYHEADEETRKLMASGKIK